MSEVCCCCRVAVASWELTLKTESGGVKRVETCPLCLDCANEMLDELKVVKMNIRTRVLRQNPAA